MLLLLILVVVVVMVAVVVVVVVVVVEVVVAQDDAPLQTGAPSHLSVPYCPQSTETLQKLSQT